MVYQYEACPTTGRRHIQGYIVFENARMGSSVKKLLGRWSGHNAHLIVALGSPTKNTEYCTKLETRIPGTQPYVFGELPTGQGTRTDLAAAFYELRTEGFSEDLVDRFTSQFVMYGSQMDRVLDRLTSINWVPREEFSPPRVHVMWGKTGTGKTRKAAEYGALFCNYDSRYPWGHYRGQDIVCLDEFCGQIPIATLLVWLDGYATTVQIPYLGNKPWIPKVIFICSNLSIKDWYLKASPLQIEAIERRCTTIAYLELHPTWGTIRRYSKGVREPEALLWLDGLAPDHPDIQRVAQGELDVPAAIPPQDLIVDANHVIPADYVRIRRG